MRLPAQLAAKVPPGRSYQAIKLFANNQKLLVVPWTVCSKLQRTFVARYGHRVGDLSKYVAMERSSVKDLWIFCSLGTFAFCFAWPRRHSTHRGVGLLSSMPFDLRCPSVKLHLNKSNQRTWKSSCNSPANLTQYRRSRRRLSGGHWARTALWWRTGSHGTPSLLQLGDLQRYVIFSTSISVSRVTSLTSHWETIAASECAPMLPGFLPA